MYFHARTLIADGRGDPAAMGNGVKALLDIWHLTFYRFGNFDLVLLTDCIKDHLKLLDEFRSRSIEPTTLKRVRRSGVRPVLCDVDRPPESDATPENQLRLFLAQGGRARNASRPG